eukprot:TRINITY_DN927_c1_g2_i6.p2 TRINITY_DN927_c1_g2~~TRINITY_DN927_c1_g2_i6.p2  ORF type:complete len:939 (+),score=152.60 TRINITY_DN927_c1_g2_i6:2656-5472(+)
MISKELRAKLSCVGFGMLNGTADEYMSPELLHTQDQVPTLKSDVWAYGVVLWEINSRKSPTTFDFEFIRNATFTADTTAVLENVVRLCWKEEPKMRCSFAEVLEVLPPSPQPEPSQPPVSCTSTRPPLPYRYLPLSQYREELRVLFHLNWDGIALDYWSSYGLEENAFLHAEPNDSGAVWMPNLHCHFYRDFMMPYKHKLYAANDGAGDSNPYLLCLSCRSSEAMPVKALIFSRQGTQRLLMPPKCGVAEFKNQLPEFGGVSFKKCKLKAKELMVEMESKFIINTYSVGVLDCATKPGSAQFLSLLSYLNGGPILPSVESFQPMKPAIADSGPSLSFKIASVEEPATIIFTDNPHKARIPPILAPGVVFFMCPAAQSGNPPYMVSEVNNQVERPIPSFPPLLPTQCERDDEVNSFREKLLLKLLNASKTASVYFPPPSRGAQLCSALVEVFRACSFTKRRTSILLASGLHRRSPSPSPSPPPPVLRSPTREVVDPTLWNMLPSMRPPSPAASLPMEPDPEFKLEPAVSDYANEFFVPLIAVGPGYVMQESHSSLDVSSLSRYDLFINDTYSFENWHRKYCEGKSHPHFTGLFEGEGQFVACLISEGGAAGSSEFYRLIMRTERGDIKGVAEIQSSDKAPSRNLCNTNVGNANLNENLMMGSLSVVGEALVAAASTGTNVGKARQAIETIHPGTRILSMVEVPSDKNASLQQNLKRFADLHVATAFKFGVIYCKEGQQEDVDFYNNERGSKEFDEFLSILGDKVILKGFTGFRGGLDVSGENNTGTHAVYTTFRNINVMFHVSTLLPFSKTDQQQVERKRHIGNDIVVFFFKEGDTPFRPELIKSQYNYVFIVVKRLDNGGYRCEVATKAGVLPFKPDVQSPLVFNGRESFPLFRDFLLCKAINAEHACYESPEFATKLCASRRQMLASIINDVATCRR